MLLKKQTVWLLTMLSLVVVLSVYYMTTPESPQSNVAVVDQQEENTNKEAVKEDAKEPAKEDTKKENAKSTTESKTTVSNVESDELFTALRLELIDERSKLKEELQEVAASKNVSATEVSKAMDKIDQLSELAEKEAVIETLIKSKGYEDALVRADGSEVNITVKTEKHSKAKANEIIQLVKKELGQKEVAVEFQPTK
ncbi:SpoIIIAH-like family protein [Priestia flexa]|jgi:stage III sporulation protein AH|uniref:Stage III sporulation protein AH n=2 Tax=Priestia TaxID=2800373 RepID=A0A0V8JN35_9BACI|nr:MULTISPECIES: SpoIIIAH-like family protein [Bacillaceae]AQX53791.1 stage III sporulation protein AH [Priestia flexa]KSU88462.1 stage III sporulation protein AH [Priestia veravalensis]KZB93152.1 stage III sporulation protein AH [Bacillus sp. VT 712]MBN8250363.1 SpoIIIAH-like family protein [Priestia flexa]MCA1200601.1 SpoIIIAH-like family protein [Priestia flexa]